MKKHLACLLALSVVGCAFAVDAAEGTPQANLKQYLQLKYSGSDIPEWLQQEINPIGSSGLRQGGDTPAEAVAIPALPYTDSGSTVDMANDIGPYVQDYLICDWAGYYNATNAGASADVFYSLHLDADTALDISLCDSDYDTSLGVFVNNAGTPGDMIAGNDDSCDSQSQVICEIPAGDYFIVVDGYSAYEGDYTLSVETTVIVDPCDNPTEVFVGDVIEADAPTENNFSGASCGTHNGYDDLYIFTLTEETTLEIEMDSSSDTAMLLLTDCSDLSSCVEYSDPSVMVATLSAGTYYLIADFYYGSGGAAYTLSISEWMDPCDLYTEGVLELGTPVSGTNVDAPDVYSGSYGDAGYTFEVTVAGSYTFSTCSANTSYGTYLYLLDASPCDEGVTEIASGSYDSCTEAGHSVGIIEEEWLEIGTYHLVVGGYSEGTFDLSVVYHDPCVDYDCTGLDQEGEGYYPGEDPPVYVDTQNGGCDTDSTDYQLVFPGDEWCGTFFTFVDAEEDNQRDSDWYEFTLSEPSDVVVSAFSCGEYYLKVLSECSTLVSTSGDETQELSGWLAAGTYQIAIYPYSTTGMDVETSYYVSLTATANDPCDTVEEIECGDTISREEPEANYFYGANLNDGCATYSHNGPDDTYQFTLTETATVTAVMTPVSGDACLFIIGECGDPTSCIAYEDGGNPETLEVELTAGTYFLVADYYSTNPTDGAYTLSLECTSDPNPPVIVHEAFDGGVDELGPYSIEANVTDDHSGVTSVFMYYRTEIGDFLEVAMTADGDDYSATIPALALGNAAEYYIVATDGYDNVSQTETYFFWPVDWSLAPRDLVASDGELGVTTIEWIAPEYAQGQLALPEGMFIESFELGIPETWTVIDADDGDDWVQFAGGYDGDYCAAILFDTPNDDWLISPAIEPTAVSVLDFYAMAGHSSWHDEVLEVMISTATADTADFVLLEELDVTDYTNWTNYQYDLSSYAGGEIYIAFHCTSDDQYRLKIDLVTVNDIAEPAAVATAWTPAPTRTVEELFEMKGNTLSKDEIARMLQQNAASERNFVGYNVYRDSNLLASVTELEFEDGAAFGAVQDQVYTYHVTAVFDAGESVASDSDTGYWAGRPTAGGPDTFGYTWESSLHGGDVSYGWIEHTGAAVELSLDDSQSSDAIALDMAFSFYGEAKDSIYVNSNGHLTFGSGYNYTGAQTYPSSSTPNDIIALWADDLDPIVEVPIVPATQILYELIEGAFVVSYINVPQYVYGDETIDDCISAQAVLYSDGDIQFNYRSFGVDLNTESYCAIGIENSEGDDGLSVRYEGDGCDLVDEMAIRFTCPFQGGNCEEAPIVAIVVSGADVELSWTEVAGATSYRVLAAADGYSSYSEVASISGLSHTLPNALVEGKQFFKVVAVCE